MTPHELLYYLVKHRHDPEDTFDIMKEYIEGYDGDVEDLAHDLGHAMLAAAQLIHRMSHPAVTRIIDMLVHNGPDALDVDIAESVTIDKLMTDDFTRKVYDTLTRDTNPADRVWTIDKVDDENKGVILKGTGFKPRVFGMIGAPDETVKAFKNRMMQYEKEHR